MSGQDSTASAHSKFLIPNCKFQKVPGVRSAISSAPVA